MGVQAFDFIRTDRRECPRCKGEFRERLVRKVLRCARCNRRTRWVSEYIPTGKPTETLDEMRARIDTQKFGLPGKPSKTLAHLPIYTHVCPDGSRSTCGVAHRREDAPCGGAAAGWVVMPVSAQAMWNQKQKDNPNLTKGSNAS